MPANRAIKISLLKQEEVEEADRIFRLAFGTFLELPDATQFMGDRSFIVPRRHLNHVKMIAAHQEGRLVGSVLVTRWGTFGFLGPLSILPQHWNQGAAQRLLEAAVQVFDRWGLHQTGLYTFAQSPKHIHLYQKFGYWPCYLTAVMVRTPKILPVPDRSTGVLALLSGMPGVFREQAIQACRKLTDKIDAGLDLTEEIRAAIEQRTGDVVLTYTRNVLDAFAVCLTGTGSEGGKKVCYVKFAAARGGVKGGERFDRLLDACEVFAALRGVTIEAGMNLAREEAYRHMQSHGYEAAKLGVAMQRPHRPGFNRSGAYVIDDWR